LWKLRFADLSNPTAGGSIEAVLDGTEGQNMLDNMAIDGHGRIIMQEDVGNAAHNGKMWLYEIATDRLVQVASHDPARFGGVGIPATPPFNQDEETSGVIDVSAIFRQEGTFLFDDQAHYAFGDPAIVEGGQLMIMHVPVAPTVDGIQVNDGAAQRSKVNSLTVTFGGSLTASDVDAGAFSLTRAEDGTAISVNVESVTSSGGKTQIVLTFSGDDVVGESLADGHYTLTIDGSKIHDDLGQAADADGDGFAGGVKTSSFHRLFGDVNGDGQVDASEVAFAAHYNGTRAGDADYLWYLDFDGNGLINGRDQSQVARRVH
jgi:hypothetical protein